MALRPLVVRDRVSLSAVEVRTREFPRLAELVSESIGRMRTKRVHPDTGPRLLVLLGESGDKTNSLLRELEATVAMFDALRLKGWEHVRRQLGRANERGHFLSISAELVVARWAHEHGLSVIEFEPKTDDGKRPDLLIGVGSEELLVEVFAPGPPENAVDKLNARLFAGLERVASGLSVDVSGYHVGPTHTSGQSDDSKAATAADIDAVINEFRRNAAQLDTSSLPAQIVTSRPGQPVTITAVGVDPGIDGTFVSVTWSESGLVPNVKRLTRAILDERQHFPAGRAGAILTDLSRWSDFRGPGSYYLDQVQDALMSHQLPAFVGAFVWESNHFAPGLRSPMHADPEWSNTGLGQAFLQAWN